MTFTLNTTFGPTIFPVTREALLAYAHASGDHNPIHQNEDFAKAVGLPDVIAHGMFTMGLAATALEEWLNGVGEIVEFETRFIKPVVVPSSGSSIRLEGSLLSEPSSDRLEIEIRAFAEGVEVLGGCRAVVRR